MLPLVFQKTHIVSPFITFHTKGNTMNKANLLSGILVSAGELISADLNEDELNRLCHIEEAFNKLCGDVCVRQTDGSVYNKMKWK